MSVAAELLLGSGRAIYTLGFAVLHSLPAFLYLLWEKEREVNKGNEKKLNTVLQKILTLLLIIARA